MGSLWGVKLALFVSLGMTGIDFCVLSIAVPMEKNNQPVDQPRTSPVLDSETSRHDEGRARRIDSLQRLEANEDCPRRRSPRPTYADLVESTVK
jgi:hypothetical protein